jgi:hypothetical protein
MYGITRAPDGSLILPPGAHWTGDTPGTGDIVLRGGQVYVVNAVSSFRVKFSPGPRGTHTHGHDAIREERGADE